MINGIHAIIYAKDAQKVRAFFNDVLGFPSVDAGHGWLIFALPPAELGIHPVEGEPHHELYLMCDDVKKTVAALKKKGAKCSRITKANFGLLTTVKIPGGTTIGLYQPTHPTALGKFRSATRGRAASKSHA